MNGAVHPMAAEIAGAMAQLMVKNGAAVTRDQLLDAGFTPAELNAHGDAARAEAANLIKRKAPPYDAFWPEPKEKDRDARRRKARATRLAARKSAAGETVNTAGHLLSSSNLPRVNDDRDGKWRRLPVIKPEGAA